MKQAIKNVVLPIQLSVVLFVFFNTYSQTIANRDTSQKTVVNSSFGNAKSIGIEDKTLHISGSFVVDTVEELLKVVDQAKKSGANTVLYSDTKLNSYGLQAIPRIEK
ncbi:hypothetical protein [Aquimarina sp. RZ0]|uniref:hypothetical protein n=1 Tax=Aquimarina sp. RZ0 TaxID=2607730 RepID=UPI0011F32467|nr:hypothetical protein [Aquimarina sp. RZ0]KAA1245015.1 hypothetical protein F0000_14165 [Aquimarina sp. RZ0]